MLAPNSQLDEVSLSILSEVIELYPKGVTKKDDSGRFPLHHLCRHLAPNYTS